MGVRALRCVLVTNTYSDKLCADAPKKKNHKNKNKKNKKNQRNQKNPEEEQKEQYEQ